MEVEKESSPDATLSVGRGGLHTLSLKFLSYKSEKRGIICKHGMTCHQTDSTILEKIQASIFSNADANLLGSSQSSKLPHKVPLVLLLGEDSFHFSGDNFLRFPFSPPGISGKGPAENGS